MVQGVRQFLKPEKYCGFCSEHVVTTFLDVQFPRRFFGGNLPRQSMRLGHGVLRWRSCYHGQLTSRVTLPITYPSKALDRPFESRKSKGIFFITLSCGWFLWTSGRPSH